MKRQKDRFRFVCRWLLENGIKPTPTMLEKFEPTFVSRRRVKFRYVNGRYEPVMTNISLVHGSYTEIRQEEFLKAGWWLDESRGSNGTWTPPK